MSYKLVLIVALSLVLAACNKKHSDLAVDQENETQHDFYIVSEDNPKAAKYAKRQWLSQFFLVEQFTVGANTSMLNAIKTNPPGGVLFWNGGGDDSEALKASIQAYSIQAKKMGLNPLLFSTDYEGGANNKTPFHSFVPGVQRFSKGFTKLAHPRWLGESVKQYGLELCQLHGKLMAKELKIVGLNYPLSVVSDLATQALTSVRGISKDAATVSKCVVEINKQFVQHKDIVFVTKHFPGIGLTRGDTHDGVVTSDVMDTGKLLTHLRPFDDLIKSSKSLGQEGQLSIMTTHAKFMGYDPNHLTTESYAVATGLLKNKMQFNGLVVSDAMWMGDYGHLASIDLMPVYMKAFLSGMDLLMIPGNRFKESVSYFRRVFDRKLSVEEKLKLEERMGMGLAEIEVEFDARLDRAIQTHEYVRGSLKHPHEFIEVLSPVETTLKDQQRYMEILTDLGN